MGLIKALISASSSTLGDQFKEFVTCPTIDKDVLIQRGTLNHGKGNKNPSEGVISNGSAIAVPQGMAMMIIENGEIKEFTAESGTYTFDTSSEPSIFTGSLGDGIKETFNTIGKRFTYGGQPAKDQRVYYVNLLNITGNKFGSPQPKKITDEKYGMLEVTFFGEYAFKVIDPIVLVNSVIGANPKDTVKYDEIVGSQLQTKFVEKLTQAITVVMRKHKVSFGDIQLYNGDISNEMNTCLDESWRQNYGLEITDVAIGDINLTEESMTKVNKVDEAAIFSNQGMQSGLMASATAEALKNASSNANGAMMGFMGMNMAGMAGQNAMGAANGAPAGQGMYNPQPQTPAPGTIFAGAATVPEKQPVEGKACPKCGSVVTGAFCSNCGAKMEADAPVEAAPEAEAPAEEPVDESPEE